MTTTTPPAAADPLARVVPWLGGLALAAPVLIARFPPMSDLPLHEASIGLLRHWGDASFAPRSVYFVNLGHSNQLFSILVYLLSWIVPIGWASKIVVASSLVALAGAAGHLADHVGASRWTALLVAPVGLGWLFFWGLVQNIIGLVVLLALLPSIDRFAERPRTRGAVAMCGAMVLLHFAHQAMQLVALLALVIFSAGASLREWRGNALRLSPIAFCAAIVYGASVYAWHFAGPMHKATRPFQWETIGYKLASVSGVLFAGYEPYVRNLMLLLATVPLAIFAVDRVRGRPRGDLAWSAIVREWRFELLAAALFGLYLVAPLTIKSTTLVYHRFLPPAWAILAIGGAARTAKVSGNLPRILCAAVPVASLLIAWPVFVDSNQVYSDLDVLLPKIEPGSTYMGLNMGPDAQNRLWSPMVAMGHIVAVKGGRSLFDYTQSPVSPVSQRANKIWAEPLSRLELHPFRLRPAWDFTRFRYLLIATPMPTRAAALTLAMRDEATLIGSQRGLVPVRIEAPGRADRHSRHGAPETPPSQPRAAPQEGRRGSRRRREGRDHGNGTMNPAVVDYYERYWREGLFSCNPYEEWKLARVRAAALAAGAGARVLDVGCGDGWVLADLAGAGVRGVGLDVSGEAVALAQRRGVEACRADIDGGRLPVDDAAFQVVLCLDVLEHLFSPDRTLGELRRAVAPGGRVMVAVPNGLNLFNRLAFAAGRHVDLMDKAHLTGHPFSEHLRFFSRAVLERALEQSGLTPVMRHCFFPDRLTETRSRAVEWLARGLAASRLHERFPSLLGLAFLYECTPMG